ncbi:MAG TPA: RNA polymerase sigma factor [Bacteroidales bacterium]|nr:RNA polymerase sigma factor [Bacteroidales bacterium]
MTTAEFNKCVEDHSDNVYRFILKNLRDEEKARDVVQDTFEKLWVRAENVSYEKARSYLFSTAYHTMIDAIRKEKRMKPLDDVDFNQLSYTHAYRGLNEVLEQALKKLPDIQRSVLLLRDYEGYAYHEIGEITGLNESQVKVYIYRARVSMKKYIGNLEAVL